MKTRRNSLDWMKMLCAILILFLHTVYLPYPQSMVKLVCRLAVPLFAMCSGFFLPASYGGGGKKWVKNNIELSVLSNLLYLFINRDDYFIGNPWYKELFSIISVFFTRGISFHLWFLTALMVSGICLYICISIFDIYFALALSVILYIVALFGNNYYGCLPGVVKSIYNLYINYCGDTWNSFFAIFIYVCIGYCLRRENTIPSKWRRIIWYLGKIHNIIFLFVLFLLENYLLTSFDIPNGNDMSIMLVPLAIGIFVWFVSQPNRRFPPLQFTKLSMLIYIFHVMVMGIVDDIIGYRSGMTDLSYLRFALVLIISFSISAVSILIKSLVVKYLSKM